MKTKSIVLAGMMYFGILSTHAQITRNCGSFICSVPDTNVACNPNTTCILTFTITNTNCCSSMNCNQIIDLVNLPDGWYVTICNPNGCFPNTTTQNAFIVPPSSKVTAKFEIHAGSNIGNADVSVKFLDVANSNNGTTYHIVGNTSTSIVSLENSDLFLTRNFPNPFSIFTTIQYNLELPNGKLIITDVQGKYVGEYKLNDQPGEVVITENLKSGIYFYSFYSNNKIITKNKMLVQ